MPSMGMNSDAVNSRMVVSAIGISENAVKVVISERHPSTPRSPTNTGLLRMTKMSRRPSPKTRIKNGMLAITFR